MKIAVISDIHGNEIAFDAVINDIQDNAADKIICLGDVATLGPSPSEVINKLKKLNCPCILGNHDEFLINPRLISGYNDSPLIIDSIEWCRKQIDEVNINYVKTFQPQIDINPDPENKILLYHGSPGSNTEGILSTTKESELKILLHNHKVRFMIGGHTHIQMLRQHAGTLFINPGSVGMPFKEYVDGKTPSLLHHAEYALIEIENGSINISLKRIPFEIDLFLNLLKSSTLPLSQWLLKQYS